MRQLAGSFEKRHQPYKLLNMGRQQIEHWKKCAEENPGIPVDE